MLSLFRSSLLIIALLAALLVPGVTAAQETPSGCTPELLAERFAAIGEEIAQAEALLSDNDTAGALAAFSAAAVMVDEVRAVCGTDAASGTATITVEPVVPALPPSLLCTEYPQYCVPFAGGPLVDDHPNEAPGLRPVLSGPSNTPHVVRGLSPEGAPVIGNPDAPIHFLEYLDFACFHCANYEDETIAPFIEQAVTSGQATYEVRLMTFVAGELSTNAAYAMLCAGEQGAAWEMYAALFTAYRARQTSAYSMDSINQIADRLQLNTDALASCISSGRYADRLAEFDASFTDLGLTGTPSMLVRYHSSDEWTLLDDRSLENLRALTAKAND